jgi:hypothetical protein
VEATGEPLCFLTRPAADGREVVWALFSGLRTMPLALPAM